MRSLVWILISCGTVVRAQSSLYYLAHAGDSPSIRTTIVIANPSAKPAKITLAGSRDDGSASTLSIPALGGSGNGPKLALTLGAGASRLLATAGTGDGSLSAIQISADIPLSVSGLISTVDSNGNITGETPITAVSADQLTTGYRAPIDTTGPALNSGIALYNPSSTAPVTATLTLLDAAGTSQGSATITVLPLRRTLRFVKGDLFPAVGDFQGSLDVATNTGGKLAAVVVRQRNSTLASLLDVSTSVSHQTRFLFPQIYDGPAPEGGLRTTFILTNLSKTASASPNIVFTREDGSTVQLTGFDPTQPVPPGGTAFWQTDGASASLAVVSALIQSDQPLAVAALVTTADGNANVLSESALPASIPNYQLLVPFDMSSGMSPGAAFLNTGGRALTASLTLLDPDGATLATAQTSPIPGNGRLSGGLQDFFPGATTTSGSILVSTGTPAFLSLASAALRTGQLSRSGAAALQIPVRASATPAPVNPKLDAAHVASADISTAGGSLSVTDAKGNKFTLTIPQGALTDRETIRLTTIASATGVSGPGLTAAVQLEPDGLALLRPATLRIDLASPAPAGAFPIGWRGSAGTVTPGLYLNPTTPDTRSLTLVMTHFSGAGVGGFDLTNDLLSIANQLDLVNSAAAYWISQGRADTLAGDADAAAIDGRQLQDTLDIGMDTVVIPMMELAMASDDEDVMRCALTIAFGSARQMELLGYGDDPRVAAISDFAQYCFQRMAAKVKARCLAKDFTAYFDVIGVLRQGALLGIPVDIDPTACLPALELDFKSQMTGDIPVGLTGSFDATISAKVILTGGFDKQALTAVTDPTKDLYTNFVLSGTTNETYDALQFIVNGVPSYCSVAVKSRTGSTLTVKPGADPQLSRAQFRFDPHYDPQALTQNGQQLCSFCPVYRKTPVQVSLWLDPGKPGEVVTVTCNGVPLDTPMNSWWTAWVTNHAATDLGYVVNWNLVNTASLLAQKTIIESITGLGGIKFTEKTDLQLKPYSRP